MLDKIFNKIFTEKFITGVVLFHLVILPVAVIMTSFPYDNIKTVFIGIYCLVVLLCGMFFLNNYGDMEAELRKLKSERK